MTASVQTPEASQHVASPERTLRLLFLTLFLRGRSSRGLKRQTAPKSIGSKLGLTLAMYALFGFMACVLIGQPVFALSVYLHAMTFVFLGMFVASSSGEVLFNDQEADILLHRPIDPRTLLWAKVRVLVEVSLWLGGAFNLAGFFIGFAAANGDWRFPLVHALSLVLEALFCTAGVVMLYQFCLRWFGRERLDGLMTTAQVLVSVAAVLSGQLLPQLMFRQGKILAFGLNSWWIALLPPAWFAGLDDALAGTGSRGSWGLAVCGVAATAVVLWIAFGKLAGDYESGLQKLGQRAVSPSSQPGRRRWIDLLLDLPPMRWWMRDSVARASFLLAAAYLARDRDVKLRLYPALAPYLAIPLIFVFSGFGSDTSGLDGFGIAFTAAYMGMIPMLGLSLLQYSQQWQASDIFRTAPIAGPASLCHGARRAVLCLLALPMTAILLLLVGFLSRHQISLLLMLLPGIVSLPVFALIPCLAGRCVPLSLPVESAKAAGRGLTMIGAMVGSMVISGIAWWAWATGWFWWFLVGETILMISAYAVMRSSVGKLSWTPLD